MKKRFVPIVVILALVVGGWFFIAGRQTEDSLIRHRLDTLAKMLSDTGPKTGQDLLIRSAQLGQFFAEDVVVVLTDRATEIRGRQSLVVMAERATREVASMDVDFADVEVIVNSDKQHAQVNITVFITGEETAQMAAFNAQEFELQMTKIDGEWVINAVAPVEVLHLDR